ncbi:hypothetical protein CO711_18590 (plasmid) [Burkholderia cepacia]|uniref:Uncharacterized protein n=1 Tax=Burkholderia cepacia TaxID=292 RepID=A0ABN5CZF5_BURCE|nr:hypothetical protein CO711_18590 [Burkholderia cepacia]
MNPVGIDAFKVTLPTEFLQRVPQRRLQADAHECPCRPYAVRRDHLHRSSKALYGEIYHRKERHLLCMGICNVGADYDLQSATFVTVSTSEPLLENCCVDTTAPVPSVIVAE